MATRYTDQHPQFTVFVNGVFSPASDGEVEFFTVGNTGESNRKNTFNTPNPSTPPLTSEINQNPVPLDGEGRTTVPVFLEGTYNTIIRDKAGNQLDQVDNVTGLGGSGGEGVPSATIENVAELREVDTLSIQNAYVISTATAGDGGQGHFYFDENATETDNGESVIEPTIGGGRWLLQNNAHNSFIYSQAAGTVDAITFNPTPVITTLDKTRFFVIQSLGPNTVTGVTVTAGTSSTLPMKRNDSTDLVVGDTGSAGYQMLIKTNEDQTRYILMNPFKTFDTSIVFSPNTIPDTSIVFSPDTIPGTSIQDNGISNSKLSDMPANTLKGNNTGGISSPLDLTATQVRSLLSLGAFSLRNELNGPAWMYNRGSSAVNDTISSPANYSPGIYYYNNFTVNSTLNLSGDGQLVLVVKGTFSGSGTINANGRGGSGGPKNGDGEGGRDYIGGNGAGPYDGTGSGGETIFRVGQTANANVPAITGNETVLLRNAIDHWSPHYRGGSGGAGSAPAGAQSDGGKGGGIVVVICDTINFTGSITCDGTQGIGSMEDAGAGGGGVIVIAYNNLTANSGTRSMSGAVVGGNPDSNAGMTGTYHTFQL